MRGTYEKGTNVQKNCCLNVHCHIVSVIHTRGSLRYRKGQNIPYSNHVLECQCQDNALIWRSSFFILAAKQVLECQCRNNALIWVCRRRCRRRRHHRRRRRRRRRRQMSKRCFDLTLCVFHTCRLPPPTTIALIRDRPRSTEKTCWTNRLAQE